MRNVEDCPYRSPYPMPPGDTSEMSFCAYIVTGIVSGHGVDRKICEACAKYDPFANPVTDALRRRLWQSRVIQGALRDGPDEPYRITVVDALLALKADGISSDTLRGYLQEAVTRGMDPTKAADAADAAGIGDVDALP